jgi:hypothetical protein
MVKIEDSSPIDDNGMVKVHGLDDTKKTDRLAEELSQKTGRRIKAVQVQVGDPGDLSYAGVIYVIDPQGD